MPHASLVIRRGLVVDGTGNAPFVGDVHVVDDQIVAVGPDLQVGSDAEEIVAEGLLVTPGWVDVHTHLDAQCSWDAQLAPTNQK